MTPSTRDQIRALIDEESDRARADMPPLENFISRARSRQQRRRAAACAAVAGAVLVIGGIGWAQGAGAPTGEAPAASNAPTPAVQIDVSTLPDHPRQDHVADLFAKALSSQGRYGGGTWIAEEKTLNIYVAGPVAGRAEATADAERAAEEITRETNFDVVVHEGGARTETELVATMDAVSDTTNYDPDGVVQVRGQRIDFSTGRVDVDVTSAAAAQLVEKEFGDAVQVHVKKPYTQDELDQMFGMPNAPAAPTGSSTSRRGSQPPPPASGTTSSPQSATRVVPFPSAPPGSAYLATIGGPLSVTDSGCAYVKTVNPSYRNVGRRYVLAETIAGSWTTELVNGTWVIKDAAGTQIAVEGQEVTMGLGIGPGTVDGTEACKELLDDAQLVVLLPQGQAEAH